MSREKHTPPRLILTFFHWFCHPDYVEDIEGDLLERYEKWTNEERFAKWLFALDVLRLFRPGIIRNFEGTQKLNNYDMLKNHIKIAFRVFKREKAFTLINVLGLATGMAIFLLIIQYARFEFSYESMFPKADRIIRVTSDYMDGETLVEQDCEVYPPVGIELRAKYPEVEDFTRAYELDQQVIQVEEKQFAIEKMYAADSTFFSIFNTPFLHGDAKNIFKKPHELVLSESTALKLFGKKDVVGELVKMPLSDKVLSLKVVGVVEDNPANTHLKYDVLMSYPTMISDFGESEDNWNSNNTYLYVLLAPNTSFGTFLVQLDGYNQLIREEDKVPDGRMAAEKISDIHLHSKKSFEPEVNGDANSVYFLLGVALLVIISAFVNYVNLATSKALDRAKEVGIRKVVGSTRLQLTAQFLVETSMLNLVAASIAVLLIFIVKPWFINIAGLPITLEIFEDITFWIVLGTMVVAGIMLSGSYPALVLSSFKSITVMKGKFGNYGKGVALRKGLVVFQFAITIVLLVQTFTVFLQLDFLKKQDLGVSIDKRIVVSAPTQDTLRQNYLTFKTELLSLSGVNSVATSGSVPGLPTSSMSTTIGINPVDAAVEHSYNFYINTIDHEYIDLMDMEILAGQNFTKNTNFENNELIVNEETLRLWNISQPEEAIGKKLRFWGREWTVLGVVKDYRQESPKAPFIPIIHRYNPKYFSFASVYFESGNPSDNLSKVQKAFKRAFPNVPFKYFFLDSEYEKQFRADQQFKQVFSVITGFAILIACLGLFGLASFSIAKRSKEIGIRKVIGASTSHILILLSSDFMKTVVLSSLVGIPITYVLVSNWLENFAVRIDLNWWLFLIPTLIVIVLALASMSFKTLKVAFSNPVESLRDE